MDYFLMSEDIEELMSDLDLKRAAVLGHSMGGKCAMVLALTKVKSPMGFPYSCLL